MFAELVKVMALSTLLIAFHILVVVVAATTLNWQGWPRFIMRTLLVAMTVTAILVAWCAFALKNGPVTFP
jgi:hypothetical protein